MPEITIPAKSENLDTVINFVNDQLEQTSCPAKAQFQIGLAVEEIFMNITNYAYPPHEGEATVRCEFDNNNDALKIILQFIDCGVKYNPLDQAEPDITLSMQERQIGGLGILLVKKTMDFIEYEYSNGKNILTVKKEIKQS